MAFDLSTAKPEKSSGFDISTARPESEVVNTRSGRGIGGEKGQNTITDMVTGGDRNTEVINSMQEIGAAPELNELSVPAFKASLGLLSTGDTDSLEGILTKQLGDKVSFSQDEKGNKIVMLPSGQYALNKPGLSGQDVARGAFDFLSFSPAAKAGSVVSAVAKNAGTEALIETTESNLGGEFNAEEVAAAGVLGGFFKGAENLAGAGYRAFKGNASNDVIEAGNEAGINLMTTDVLPPQKFYSKTMQQTAEKIPFAGTGGPREQQQMLRERAVSNIAEKYGQFSYEAVVDSLKTQKNRVKSAAGAVLSNSGKKLDEAGVIGLTNTDKAISDVVEILNKQGVIKANSANDELKVLIDALQESPQSYTTLKENRTAFREIVNAADGMDKSQLTSRAKSLLQRVEGAMKKDMDTFAKDNLTFQEFTKLNRANAVYGEQARLLTKSRLKNVLDKGDITPEAVENLLFSSKPSEVKSLYASLTQPGRENARSAIISRVVNNLEKRRGGLTPNTFFTEMKKMGMQTDVFFKGQDRKALEGLLLVLGKTTRAQDAAITTPTGQSLLGVVAGAGLVTDLATTAGLAGSVGGLARLYESAPVRNALLRLSSIPKGSTAYEQALKEATEILSAASQTAREEAQEE